MKIKLDIKRNDQKILMDLLKKYLPDSLIWAFGSRVKFTSNPHSDLDLTAFITPQQEDNFNNLKDALAESDLPFRVDLHDWNAIPDNFRKNIMEKYVVLQEVKNYTTQR